MELERLAKPALGMYKRMLKLAKRLPAADAADAKIQIREAFRANKDERNDERFVAAHHGAEKERYRLVGPVDITAAGRILSISFSWLAYSQDTGAA